jgi:hypothetical protein
MAVVSLKFLFYSENSSNSREMLENLQPSYKDEVSTQISDDFILHLSN